MKKSIGRKIFIYMIAYSIIIVAFIGIVIKFVLPEYYLNHQIDKLEKAEERIKNNYNNLEMDLLYEEMETLQNDLGGQLYYYDESEEQVQGYAYGRGRRHAISSSSDQFSPTGDISTYTYENKLGVDVYVIGVLIEDYYLVYEVGIQTLNKAVDAIINFIGILLAFVFLLALIVSYILSKTISKPIIRLNDLAQSMKTKNVKPILITKEENEIGELNQTLNELYEELLGNIYKLKTELNKERNSEKLKKRFLAAATHELKTPVAVIRGYSEILYDGIYESEEERDRYIKNIYDETESVEHLMVDILDYTKMETGNYKLSVSQEQIKPFIEELIERYKDYIEKRDIAFEFHINISKDMKKNIDKYRIEQVYKNLISNAVEHSDNKIRVNIESIGEKIRLSVFNSGSRIAADDLPNIFESFYKKQGKKSGTGLGLAIVKEIILLHNGEYRVENHEDGVEFIVLF